MPSLRCLQSRARSAKRRERFATTRLLLLWALLLNVNIAGMTRAQAPPPPPTGKTPSADPDDNCSIKLAYRPCQFESFLVKANDVEGKFVYELKEAMQDLVDLKTKNVVPEAFRRFQVRRVVAPPGFGKSALLRYLERLLKKDPSIKGTGPQDFVKRLGDENEFHLKDHFCKIQLNDLGNRFAAHSITVDELTNDGGYPMPAFGRLRAFDYDDHAAPDIRALTEAFKESRSFDMNRHILLIDSIDEIHPDSASSLLERVDGYARQRSEEDEMIIDPTRKGFLRVFVVGRAEGFMDYYRSIQKGVSKEEPVVLEPPKYEHNKDKRAVVRWAAQFLISGDIGDTVDPKSQAEALSTADDALHFMHPFSWLENSCDNLSAINDLVKISSGRKAYAQKKLPRKLLDTSEFELKEIFFQYLLARAKDSHNRPASRSEDYVKLFEGIAANFAGNDDVDDEEFFVVAPFDVVSIKVKVGKNSYDTSYLVKSVLNRSGLVLNQA
jgi:hypothetical protein